MRRCRLRSLRGAGSGLGILARFGAHDARADAKRLNDAAMQSADRPPFFVQQQRDADRLAELRDGLRNGSAIVAGVLSGTSADGIDVALVRFGFDVDLLRPRTLAFATLPFPASLAVRVRAVLDGVQPSLAELAGLDRDLGRAFGLAARELARKHGLSLDLVASHGQTVWHHDGIEPSGRATLQLGDGCHVAEAAGCPTVSDLRQADVAAGGEGAPIAALADDVVFAGVERPLLVLNLGGISNLTRLPAAGEELLSFDTGPCGCLLDGLARRLFGEPFDAGGARAARGRLHPALVAEWSRHPFFAAPAPKSTGRDTFGERWIDELTSGLAGIPAEDLLCTAAEFVAECVAIGIRRNVSRPGPLILCGGGMHHAVLVRALALRTALPVSSSSELGVDPDAREALVFAVLGARCVLGIPSTSPAATGARSGRVLGKLSLGPFGPRGA